MASNTMWNGVADFNKEFDAVQIDSPDSLPSKTENSVLVSIPYLDYTAADLEKMKEFAYGGGTLILADDFGYGNRFLEYIKVDIRFSHELLLDPLFCYKNEYLPCISDFSTPIEESGITAITFNYGSTLNYVPSDEAIARSSNMSFLDLNHNGSRDESEPDEPEGPFVVAAAFPLGKGMVELITDPSLVLNSMMGKTNNYQFLQYLTSNSGQSGEIMFDRAHLSKSPVDISKMGMNTVRKTLSNPYALLGITALVFIMVALYTWKRGVKVD